MKQFNFKVTDPAGMHARPATVVVSEAGKYKSEIKMSFDGKTVDMKSIMGVVSLGIPSGADVIVTADGEDEELAITNLIARLVDSNLGEIY